MIVQIVRFRSELSDDEVRTRYASRVDRYRQVPGLIEKYYVAYPTGEHGAVYVWESEEALKRFRDSHLGTTIAGTYEVRGEPTSEVAPVVLTLRSSEGSRPAGS